MDNVDRNDIIQQMAERGIKPGAENAETALLLDILKRVPEQVEKYEALLREDKEEISRLSAISRADLNRNIVSLTALRGLLTRWSISPRSFNISKREVEETSLGTKLSLKLRKPGDREELPLQPENAQQQLSLYLDFRPHKAVTKEEVFEAISFKGLSPQEVLERCRRFLPRDARLIINTVSVWVNPKTERVKIEPGGGVEFRYSAGSRVTTRGVAFVGVSPHYSDDLSSGVISPEEIVFLREQVNSLYPQRFR